MRALLQALAALSVCLALAACGTAARSGSDASTLRRDDIRWVAEFRAWLDDFDRDLRATQRLRVEKLGGRDVGDERYAEAVARLESCVGAFDQDVGLPHLRRLRMPARLMRAACSELARGERAQQRAFSGNPGDELMIGAAAIDRGELLALRAWKLLDSAFAWNRPLRKLTGRVSRSRIEPRFAGAAETISPEPIEVRCWSEKDWGRVRAEFAAYNGKDIDPSGFVSELDQRRFNLAPEICDELASLLYGPAEERVRVDFDRAWAIGVLAHETEHLVSPGTEAETECYGQQDVRALARALGVPKAQASQLAELHWREGYPSLPDEYRTPLCYDGGPLDAHPTSSVWP